MCFNVLLLQVIESKWHSSSLSFLYKTIGNEVTKRINNNQEYTYGVEAAWYYETGGIMGHCL